MVYQELVNYVRGGRAAGYDDADIRSQLSEAGWLQEDVDEAFRVAEGLAPLAATEKEAEIAPPIVEQPSAETRRGRPMRTYEIARMQRQQGRQTFFEKQLGEEGAGSQLPQQPMARAAEMAKQMGEEEEEKKKFSFWRAWFACIVRPSETLRRGRYHASYLHAALGYAIVPLALGLVTAVALGFGASAIQNAVEGVPGLGALLAVLAGYGIALSIVGAVANAGVAAVAGFFGSGISFLLSRLFGGQGTLKQHAFLDSVVFVPATLSRILGAAILIVGVFLLKDSALIAAIAAAFFIIAYPLALSVLAVREAQLVSTGRAAAIALLPLALVALVAAAIALATGMALSSLLGGIVLEALAPKVSAAATPFPAG